MIAAYPAIRIGGLEPVLATKSLIIATSTIVGLVPPKYENSHIWD